ncbi:hypothetical protein Cantr_07324 [Candida viswanathii]|uniref:Uncharacterized protein n=1 Tax=Candida viswanathii TaxID=5486 RepID=A0A367Y2B7_9ASCO|nr:hypothetical protein Cantr_07324 [Candida viswanathii]
MVATRRSAGKHVDVELSDNGKELQKVIPIEKQRQLQMKQHHSSSLKRETRGRKKKQRKSQDDTPSSSAWLLAATLLVISFSIAQPHPSSSGGCPVAVKKIETRGRKRKIHDATDNNPHQHNQQEQPNSKKQHLKVDFPVESANNVVADKHKINHLLTNDSPPPPPAPQWQPTTARLLHCHGNHCPTNLITISAPQFVKKPTPLRPVLPTPRTSSISTVVNALRWVSWGLNSSPSALPNPPPGVALAGSGPDTPMRQLQHKFR